jgi:hypothetical protein
MVHRGRPSASRDLSGGGVTSPRHCLTFPWPVAILSICPRGRGGHSFIVVSTAQRQQAAGAAQVGPQAAGAQQLGAAQAGAAQAGAAQVGAQPVEQPVLQQLLRTLQQRILGQRSFGILKQCDRPQPLLQPVLQQVEAGAQQLGAAQAAGAPQLGAQAAGAQQLGAGAAQVAGAQPQPLLPWRWNRPASALLMLAKQTSAAVIHANFILTLLQKRGRGT